MMPFDISVVASAEAIPRQAWERLSPPGHPFLNADFLAILERHGAAGPEWGWAARHLVARDTSGAVVGILPLYLRSNSFGDFIHDWSWAGAYQQLGKNYYPRLLSGLPHTPAAGPRILVDEQAHGPEARAALVAAAQQLAADHGLSSWHLAFPDLAEFEAVRSASNDAMAVSHNVQFQWRDDAYGDFDGYLGSFSSARRRKVRAERRRVAESGLVIEVRHGDELDPAEWPALHALYAATFEKFDNHAVFTAAFGVPDGL
jgi:uncharacterized protein